MKPFSVCAARAKWQGNRFPAARLVHPRCVNAVARGVHNRGVQNRPLKPCARVPLLAGDGDGRLFRGQVLS
jgi:hypothetical protein